VGGVSERPTRETERSDPFTRPSSQRWKAPRSTGCRQPSRDAGRTWVLVGPSRLCGARSRAVGRTDDNRCPLDAEEGNVVSVRQAHALFVETPNKRPPRSRTRPSLGPETRARRSSLNSSGVSRGRWRDRFGIAVGQTCVSRRNRHRGRNGRTLARLAARHRFTGQLVEVVRDASEKEGGYGHRPCEETRAPVGVRTSCAVAEVGRQHPGLE